MVFFSITRPYKTTERILIDEDIQIKLHGLPNENTIVELICAVLDEKGRKFKSAAKYRTKHKEIDRENSGKFKSIDSGKYFIDLWSDEAIEGDFSGLYSMGHFWSLKAEDASLGPIRLAKANVTTPFEFVFTAIVNGIEMAQTEIKRWYMAENVKRVEVRENGLRAALFIPAGSQSRVFPTVIDLFGSAGGRIEFRSALLASRGVASLALAYFAFEDLPESYTSIQLDYFETAIDWLSAQDFVQGHKVGVIGVSLGALIALMMGSLGSSRLGAVVSINGPHIITQSLYHRGHLIKGVETLFDIGSMKFELVESTDQYAGVSYGLVHDICEAGKQKGYEIPIEKAKCPVLILSGTDDRNWDSCFMGDQIIQRLTQFRHPFESIHCKYPGVSLDTLVIVTMDNGRPLAGTTPFTAHIYFIPTGSPNTDALGRQITFPWIRTIALLGRAVALS